MDHKLAAILGLSGLVLTTPCFGQSPPAAPPRADVALEKKAGALFDEGRAAFKKGRFAEARAAYLAAFRIHHHWQIAANLSDCERQLGLNRDAAEHLYFYVQNAPEDRVQKAEIAMKDALLSVGMVRVNVSLDGAEVLVDGKSVGLSPLSAPLFVDPGQRTIAARYGDWPVVERTLDMLPGPTSDVSLVLHAPDLPAQAAPVVQVNSPSAEGPNPWLAGGGLLASVAFATSGALLLAAADDEAGRRASQVGALGGPSACASPPPGQETACSDLRASTDDEDLLRALGASGFVLSGAALVATAVYVFWPEEAPSEPSTSGGVGPVVTPDFAGMTYRTRF